MKKMLALLAITLLLSATAFAAAAPTPVLAANGDQLRVGTSYYISSIGRGAAGGDLTLASRNNSVCPLYVAQQSSDVKPGISVRFYPVSLNQTIIHTSTDLNVVFDFVGFCGQSTVWKLGLDNNDKWRWYVGTGGTVGNPGMKTVSNWFRIEKDEKSDDYKMVFCPTVCKSCIVPCGNLGIFHDGGRRFLGLTDHSHMVMFKKAYALVSE